MIYSDSGDPARISVVVSIVNFHQLLINEIRYMTVDRTLCRTIFYLFNTYDKNPIKSNQPPVYFVVFVNLLILLVNILQFSNLFHRE